MNIMVETKSANCTHLAAPRIIRTQKFIIAVAHGAVFLSTEFVDKCLESTKRPYTEKYLLNDKQGEQQLGSTLPEIRVRALANNRQLLKGYHMFCTESNFDIYKAICEANGGKCLLFRGQRSQQLAIKPLCSEARDPEIEDENVERDAIVYLVSGVEAEDKKLWPKFNSMVLEAKKVPRVVKNDWLTNALLRQKVDWADEYQQEGSSV